MAMSCVFPPCAQADLASVEPDQANVTSLANSITDTPLLPSAIDQAAQNDPTNLTASTSSTALPEPSAEVIPDLLSPSQQGPPALSTHSTVIPPDYMSLTRLAEPSIRKVTTTRVVAPKATGINADSVVIFSFRTTTGGFTQILQLAPTTSSRKALPSTSVIVTTVPTIVTAPLEVSTSSSSAVNLPEEQVNLVGKDESSPLHWYIVVGAVVGVLLLLLSVMLCYRRAIKRKKDRATLTRRFVFPCARLHLAK